MHIKTFGIVTVESNRTILAFAYVQNKFKLCGQFRNNKKDDKKKQQIFLLTFAIIRDPILI